MAGRQELNALSFVDVIKKKTKLAFKAEHKENGECNEK